MTNQPSLPEPELEPQYSPEELAEAAQDIAQLTPEAYLDMQAEKNHLIGMAEARLPEMPNVTWVDLVSPKSGAVVNFTVRGYSPEQVLDSLVRGLKYAKEHYGLIPTATGNRVAVAHTQPKPTQAAATASASTTAKAAPAPIAAPAAKIPPKAAPKPAVATPPPAGATSQYAPRLRADTEIAHDGYFAASMVAATANTVIDDEGESETKVYLKVIGKNSKFPKFPVTIWPEVVAALGWDVDEMMADFQSSFPVNLDGYDALYVKNDKGNPAKVIALLPQVQA